METNNLLN